MNERLRILILTANPANMTRLKLEAEHRRLRNIMHDNAEVGNCEIFVEWAARLTEVEQALKTYQPHVAHFAGHGNADYICLEDDNGASRPVSKEQLSELINSAPGHLRLVVLNACYSAPQMEKLGQLVDYIVGTNSPVADDAAVRFAADFYQGLALGGTVREAFHQAQGNLAAGGVKAQADRYQLLVRPGADEKLPLLPPFADNQVKIDIAKVISAHAIDIANKIVEGPGALVSPEEQPPNQRNNLEIRAKRMKSPKISFANEIRRTSK